MHARNPYKGAPDFVKLADAYPALQQYLLPTTNGATINFQDQAAQRCLTEALLHRDFGVSLELPEDRLCPPVPNRLNYILWLQDVVHYTQEHLTQSNDVPCTGIDVGTGASAIYPLLGCSVESQWHFIATDIDERSTEYAKQNVQRNGLEDRVTVIHVDTSGPIFAISPVEETKPTNKSTYEFTMCNPPFYSSHDEVLASAEIKEFGPSAVCTGADNEMITPGGEVAFVCRMINESLGLKERCRWYTSMLGKMSSLTEIVNTLRKEKIENYAITEFVQGRTRRWAIAWSFTDIHLPDSLARVQNPSLQNLMPLRNTFKQSYSDIIPMNDLRQILTEVLAGIESVTSTTESSHTTTSSRAAEITLASATGDTWSRAARRRKLRGDMVSSDTDPAPIQLVCAMRIGASEDHSGSFIEFQWVRGRSRALFESLMGHVGRKVGVVLNAS